jgi:outer membrane receptor protein involved in Fe transport
MADHPAEAAQLNQDMMTKFVELYPQSYWDAYGYNIDVAAIKAGDWSHIVRGTDFPYYPPELGGNGGTIHGIYPTIDQNLESKGYELEVTFKPMDNWDITMNASKVNATQTGLGQAAQDQLQGMADLFLGTGVQYAGIWGTYEGAKDMFLSQLWAPYLTQLDLIGTEQPELSKYRFNLVTNYRFNEGMVKGLSIGGAYRWESKAILSYGIHQTEIYGESAYISDVSQPYYGPSNDHVDLWAGYSHKLNEKIDWKVQLNVRNVGEKTHLVPVSYEPNGDVAQARIQTGTEYNLSLKLMF